MTSPLKILLLEDSVPDAELVMRELRKAQWMFTLQRVQTQAAFIDALDEFAPDIILSDHTLPDYDGLSALDVAKLRRPNVPFIFVSGTLGEERAVESLQHGASDFVVKGNLRRLPSVITRALKENSLRREHEFANRQIHVSEEKFRSLANQTPVGTILFDLDNKITFCNPAIQNLLGMNEEEIIHSGWEKMVHPADQERLLAKVHDFLADHKPFNIELRMLSSLGETLWIDKRIVNLHNPEGELTGFMSLLIDKTVEKLAERKIVRLSRIHAVLSGINAAIVRVSDHDNLLRDACNIAVTKGNFRMAWIALIDDSAGTIVSSHISGFDSDLIKKIESKQFPMLADVSKNAVEVHATGKTLIFNDLLEGNRFSKHLERMEVAEIASIAYLPLTLGQRKFGFLALGAETKDFFTDDEMQLLHSLAGDIAFALDHLEKEKQVNYLAYYDALTDLPNRTLFLDHLKQQVSNFKAADNVIAVVIFDVDKFRHINESLGEHSGDQLLQAIARRLTANASDATLLGRIGGDTFGFIILHCPDATSLMHSLENKLNEWAATPFLIGNEEISMSFKAGVALFPDDGNDAESLLQNANAALKRAKHSSQRLLFYSRQINEHVSEHLKLESRLRHAIEQQQFDLYYQPKINLKTGRIGSMEALMRWKDPERGLIPPIEFIPLLEETGLIYEMGMWALQRAFDDHAKLRQLFTYAPYIAVNVSALQLKRKTFYDDVLQVLGKATDGRHGVDIEITESLIMENIEDNIRKLKEVREHNVHIAIDDFGTGYSSLAYIAKLPIDILKIDRSFIVRMAEADEDRAIVSTIITLAHSLDLKVVAEGVETEEQAQMLRLLRCDEAQGYLFCRPLPFDELVKRLTVANGVVTLNS